MGHVPPLQWHAAWKETEQERFELLCACYQHPCGVPCVSPTPLKSCENCITSPLLVEASLPTRQLRPQPSALHLCFSQFLHMSLPPIQVTQAAGQESGGPPAKPVAVVAFGGNALLSRGEPLSMEAQWRNATKARGNAGWWLRGLPLKGWNIEYRCLKHPHCILNMSDSLLVGLGHLSLPRPPAFCVPVSGPSLAAVGSGERGAAGE
jgi:hypothetical protein